MVFLPRKLSIIEKLLKICHQVKWVIKVKFKDRSLLQNLREKRKKANFLINQVLYLFFLSPFAIKPWNIEWDYYLLKC
jgi:hypothetical protein